jgi:hypothetical protein
MKIRGESGSMPARMGGAASGASRGGSTPKVAKPAKADPKVEKKLKQLDRRSKAVAPKKKYSDMTPAEKRKWDSLNAEYTNRMISKPKK